MNICYIQHTVLVITRVYKLMPILQSLLCMRDNVPVTDDGDEGASP